MSKRFLSSLACALLLFNPDLMGQQYNLTNYGLEHGLPQATVFCTYEDAHGYLWVGTESGVARFNGVEFVVYDSNDGLPGNNVRSVAEGADGRIWVATDRGVGIFNGQEWTQITESQGLKGSAVLKLLPDNQGRMWAATNDHGVNIISTTYDSIAITNLSGYDGLAGDFVLDIHHDSKGRTWLALIGGINTITPADEGFVISNLEDSAYIPSNLISCVDEDAQGNLWFGTLNAGFFKLSKQNGHYDVTIYNHRNGMDDPRVWDIFCDDQGRVWIGSNENGLYYMEDGAIHNITTGNGLPGNLILSISRDRNGNLWLGSMNGLSLFRGFHFIHYTTADGLPGNQILAVKATPDGNIWVGSDGRGFARLDLDHNKLKSKFFGPEVGFTGRHVISIDFDSDGSSWIYDPNSSAYRFFWQ